MTAGSDVAVATLDPENGTSGDATGTPPRRRWVPRIPRPDLYAFVVYTAMACYLMERVWRHLSNYAIATNATDQNQFEFFLVHAVRVAHGAYPFFTDQMNSPNGVNLMANTATLGLHLPMVPITMLFGPNVSFAIEMTLVLVLTAFAWYWFFSRHLVRSRFAAFVGGGFCAFAPGMVSQSNAHPNITAQFLIPVIIWRVIRLREPGRALRNGAILAVLVIYQCFINEEVLFITAMAFALFVAVWAISNWAEAKASLLPFLRGAAVTTGITLAAMIYPLYVQFLGPQHYHGMWSGSVIYGNDVYAFFTFARESLAGYAKASGRVSPNPTEQNSFFGWPLLVLCVFLLVLFWRNIVARAAVVSGIVMSVLSVGPLLIIDGHKTHHHGPYAPFMHIPIFDSVISTRLVLAAIPVIGLLLAMWLDRWWTGLPADASRYQVRQSRVIALGLVVAALLPIAPTPLPVVFRQPTPVFFSSGEWRQYVPSDRAVVTVPVSSLLNSMDGLQWDADQGLGFRLAGGYFLGPDPTGRGMFGAPWRPTGKLFDTVMRKGVPPHPITEADRATALEDLRYWRAAIVVLAPYKTNADALRALVTQLLGFAPVLKDGVWLWDVRPLVG